MTALSARMREYVDQNLGWVITMGMLAFFVVLFAITLWDVHRMETQWNDFKAKCEARGGFVLRGECLDKRSRISVE